MDKLQLLGPLFQENPFEKFVQLYVGKNPILAVGSFDRKHGSILDEVLTNAEIAFDRTFECTGGVKHAPLTGDDYQAVGMGMVFDRGEDLYLLRGKSDDYLLKPHRPHLASFGEVPRMRFEIQ